MNKFEQFAIILDDPRKSKNTTCFKKLINALSEKLTNHRPGTVEAQNILKMYRSIQKEASYGDGFFVRSSSFEHDLLKDAFRKSSASTKQFNLMRDFESLLELLASICEEPKRKREIDIEITVEVPRPKKLKKVTSYEKITILERWVKIGFQMYPKNFDTFSGEEYIVVDGDVYLIKQNRYGQEYLA